MKSERAATEILERWQRNGSADADVRAIVTGAITGVAAEKARLVFGTLEALAKDLAQALHAAAQALDQQDVPTGDELSTVLKEMPRIDLGTLELEVRLSFWVNLWKAMARRQIESRLRNQIGATVSEAFSSYGRMLEAWSRRMLAELQGRFDAHADTYRAYLDRLTAEGAATPLERETIQRDLDSISQERKAQLV